jgi:ADP-ribose pyrophosphatase YjhB (NUDIX family)
MRLRRTSRLILLDAQDRVLLFRTEDDSLFAADGSRVASVWLTPGGALEPGEDHEEAARRELWEETGIVGVEPGPWVAVCEPVFAWKGERIRGHDRYYLSRVETADVSLDHMAEVERAVYREHRWWTIPDLRSSRERIFPLGLGELMARIVAGDLPDRPVRLR